MKPVVDGLAKEVAGRYDVKVMNLSNADESMNALADQLKIEYVPTFVYVTADGKVANTVVGGTTREAILNELGKLK